MKYYLQNGLYIVLAKKEKTKERKRALYNLRIPKNSSDTLLTCGKCATSLFLPHFDVTCDLLLNRRTATWNPFVKYYTYISFFFPN